ncbi:MAG: TetR family transcriptional regulator [Hyphomicrobiales bacterium]|nr:TetR family transcriptional regulator [Hyphomicrobiales bacterium]
MATPTATWNGEATGRRESNKRDKLMRIRVAAQHLFITKGFDETTVREIAREAGVGIGTLFSYSLNKRDLLFLIGNDGLEEVAREAAARISANATLARNLRAIFAVHYAFFMGEDSLGRDVLREMTFYDSGPQAERFRAIRSHVLELVVAALRHAVARGELPPKRRLRDEAWVLFAIYQVELRAWLAAGTPDLAKGMRQLDRSLGICIRGLKAGASKRGGACE